MISLVARWRFTNEEDEMWNSWCEWVVRSNYIWRERARWVARFIGQDVTVPARIFRENVVVPRALLHRLLGVVQIHDAKHCSIKSDTFWQIGIQVAVKVLACLKSLGTGAPLRKLEDGSEMGKEAIISYMRRFIRHVKDIYGATSLNRPLTQTERGFIARIYPHVWFPGYIGAVH